MVIPRSPMMEFIEYWTTFETKKLLKSSPLFAFKMAIRHRLFPMTMMRDALPPSIRGKFKLINIYIVNLDTYKDDLKNADQLDATPYPKNTLMDILKEISESGWKTLQMLLSRQTDTDEEKLLIQNHESSPLLKLAKFYIRSEQKYGDTYIPPQLFNRDDICIRERNLGGNRDLEFENEDNENHSMNVTGSAQDFDSVSIDWNTEII
jgi:Fe-S cluster biosynthesis and repair protein YggX